MLFSPPVRRIAAAFRDLVYCNPFNPQRVEHERHILGDDFVALEEPWNVIQDPTGERPNIDALRTKAKSLADAARERLLDGADASDREIELYEGLVVYLLFGVYAELLPMATVPGGEGRATSKPVRDSFRAYPQFVRDVRHYLDLPGRGMLAACEPPHLIALFFQIRRAFHHIFTHLAGRSVAAARLRASIWESVFTHDMVRYRRSLYQRMADFTTLITGPSGTGKELVARAIALSRYIPYDDKAGCFVEDFTGSFYALSVSALSPTLIESELFGHRRGAFTGALENREGWLETCPAHGTVFLDEVGEIDPLIQVKLLRVLQFRVFQRLGDTQPRQFRGKIVAATNRDLAVEMASGRFRRDFYYRLCADMIQTPSLHEQLVHAPSELMDLVLFIARREAGDEADALAQEVVAWVSKSLEAGYAWPGNFRELEQCVRNVMVRREYHPPKHSSRDADGELCQQMIAGTLTADELLRAYCKRVYSQCGSYEETARRLKLDRRTVKAKVTGAV